MESRKNNKAFLKPGTTFISKRTANFKYVDRDGTECWVVPMSRYYAAETILRGQPVTVCQFSDFTTDDFNLRNNTDPYVKVFDPNVDEFCIGVATNYVEKDEIVNIQSKGKFDYLTTKSKKAVAEGDNPREVYIDMSKATWMYNEVRGQTVYVCAKDTQFPNGHDSNPEEHRIDSNNTLTYDFIDSVYTAKNTIQLGHLTDAPIDLSNDPTILEDQVVTLELDVTGDTRGPLDNTQHILTLGETISFDRNHIEDDGINGNSEIFNEVKAVAISPIGKEKPTLYTLIKEGSEEANISDLSFVAIRNATGRVVIIPIGSSEFNDNFDRWDLTDATDRGYRSLIKSYCNQVVIESPIENLAQLPNKIKTVFESFTEIGADYVTLENRTGDEGTYYVGEKEVGWFDIYESQNLKTFLNVQTIQHGSSAEKGTAVLADIRDANRTNVVGIVLSNQVGTHPHNDPDKPNTIKVIKQGRFITEGSLVPGAEYYLSTEGRITIRNQAWYDTCVKIGTAENEHTLLVDIQNVQHDYSGAVPIGFVKPCIEGNQPEKGFILADGETRYSKEDYAELLDYLHSFYTPTELEEDADTFLIPKILVDAGAGASQVAQIKYISNGLYNNIPRAPSMRFSGVFDEEGKIADVNISKLVHYGTLEQSRIAPTLENIDIKLFYFDPETNTLPEGSDSYAWREIPVGFYTHNVDTLYGFEWAVIQDDARGQDGLYLLHMHIGDGLGVCKLSGHRGPISLAGKQFKLIVTAKNLWTREFSLLDESNIATDMETDTNTVAPSVNAVREYYERQVKTKKLIVHYEDEETHEFIGEAEIDKLRVKEIDVEGKEIVYSEDLAEHVNTSANTEEGVHGLVNLGLNGNIDAKTVAGLMLGKGSQNVTTESFEPSARDYIPYVEVNAEQNLTSSDDTNIKTLHDGAGAKVLTQTRRYRTGQDAFFYDHVILESPIDFVEKVFEFNNTKLTETIEDGTEFITVTFDADGKKINIDGLNSLLVKEINFANASGTAITGLDYTEVINLTNSSTIAYKKDFKEFINKDLRTLIGNDLSLTPNLNHDQDGIPLTLNNGKVTMPALPALTDIASALQALYELPISEFKYKVGEDKKQLGILIERVKQTIEKIGDADSYGHEISMKVPQGNNFDDHLSFNYSDTEINNIVNYLDLVVNKKELGQELRSTVGILLKAAAETQERLLDVEASIFGYDAKTIPGDLATRQSLVNSKISTTLQNDLTNIPLFFGLNRLIRALCLEVFDTTDLNQLVEENLNQLIDTESPEGKVSLKSRLDLIDEELSKIVATNNSIARLYKENLKATESLFEPACRSNTPIISPDNFGFTYNKVYESTCHAENEFDVMDHTWKSLPSAEEYIHPDEFTGYPYATVSNITEKHKPVTEDIQVLKVPKLKEVTLTEGTDGHPITFEALDLDSNNLPKLDNKEVVNLSAKVERINKKLSEITKVVYGKDEVLADPNTLTTIKRDVKNLINDLYPNSDLNDVRGENGLFNPFRKSATDGRDLINDNKGDVTDEELDNTTPYSVLRYLSKELFNYRIDNNYLNISSDYFNDIPSGEIVSSTPGLSDDLIDSDSEDSGMHAGLVRLSMPDNSSIRKFEREEGGFEFKTSIDSNHLNTTDESLGKAYTQFNFIEDAIGIQNIIVTKVHKDLLEAHKEELYAKNENNVYVKDLPVNDPDFEREPYILTYFDELRVKDCEITGNTLSVVDVDPIYLGRSTKISTLLSRKSKNLASRITTVEAALDDISYNWDGSRFELSNIPEFITSIKRKAEEGINTWLPPMENIIKGSLGFGGNDGRDVLAQNLKLLTEIKNNYKVIDSTRYVENGNQLLTINLIGGISKNGLNSHNGEIRKVLTISKGNEIYQVPILYSGSVVDVPMFGEIPTCIVLKDETLNLENIVAKLTTDPFEGIPGLNLDSMSERRQIDLLKAVVKELSDRIAKDEPQIGDVLTTTNHWFGDEGGQTFNQITGANFEIGDAKVNFGKHNGLNVVEINADGTTVFNPTSAQVVKYYKVVGEDVKLQCLKELVYKHFDNLNISRPDLSNDSESALLSRFKAITKLSNISNSGVPSGSTAHAIAWSGYKYDILTYNTNNNILIKRKEFKGEITEQGGNYSESSLGSGYLRNAGTAFPGDIVNYHSNNPIQVALRKALKNNLENDCDYIISDSFDSYIVNRVTLSVKGTIGWLTNILVFEMNTNPLYRNGTDYIFEGTYVSENAKYKVRYTLLKWVGGNLKFDGSVTCETSTKSSQTQEWSEWSDFSGDLSYELTLPNN